MRLIPVSTLVLSRILRSIAEISAKFGGNTLLTPYCMYVLLYYVHITLCIGLEWFRTSIKILRLVLSWSRSRPRSRKYAYYIFKVKATLSSCQISVFFSQLKSTYFSPFFTRPQSQKGADCAGWYCRSVVRDHLRTTHGHELCRLTKMLTRKSAIHIVLCRDCDNRYLLLSTHLHLT